MMFDDMVKKYDLNISSEEVETVKALISGKKERCKYVLRHLFSLAAPDNIHYLRLGKTMPFLFEIVANDRNGIDVDKCVFTHLCTL